MSRLLRILSLKRIQRLYDSLSSFYDALTQYETSSRKRALEIAHIKENSVILEIGFGSGKVLAEIANRKGYHGEVFGLDISEKMTKKTRKTIQRVCKAREVHLLLGDAANVPFRSSMFDLVCSSYMLDLIDTPKVPLVLLEIRRVLRSSGRLVFVGLSRGSKWYDNMRLYEWLYRHMPTLLGGCRPIQLSPYLEKLGFK